MDFIAFNLIFLISIAVSFCFAIGAAAGIGLDLDMDGDGDLDMDVSDDGGGGALDVGKVPITMRLFVWSLLFGLSGLMFNVLATDFFGGLSVVGSILSGVSALTVTLFVGSVTVKLIGRYMPTTESYNVSRHQFLGCSGVAVTQVDGEKPWGSADISDHEGNVHRIACTTLDPEKEILRGTEIVIADYDEDRDLFTITEFDPGLGAEIVPA